VIPEDALSRSERRHWVCSQRRRLFRGESDHAGPSHQAIVAFRSAKERFLFIFTTTRNVFCFDLFITTEFILRNFSFHILPPPGRRALAERFTSSMWSGTKHDASKVPVVLAGGLRGTLPTGRVLDYASQGDDNRKLCSMYLSIMDRMGVKLERFGDAKTRLGGF
jgi:hypothetical protein